MPRTSRPDDVDAWAELPDYLQAYVRGRALGHQHDVRAEDRADVPHDR